MAAQQESEVGEEMYGPRRSRVNHLFEWRSVSRGGRVLRRVWSKTKFWASLVETRYGFERCGNFGKRRQNSNRPGFDSGCVGASLCVASCDSLGGSWAMICRSSN